MGEEGEVRREVRAWQALGLRLAARSRKVRQAVVCERGVVSESTRESAEGSRSGREERREVRRGVGPSRAREERSMRWEGSRGGGEGEAGGRSMGRRRGSDSTRSRREAWPRQRLMRAPRRASLGGVVKREACWRSRVALSRAQVKASSVSARRGSALRFTWRKGKGSVATDSSLHSR
jgi:hypothetical protein